MQVTLFPVITGQTGVDPIFQGAADFDLELVENRTLDGQWPPFQPGLPRVQSTWGFQRAKTLAAH